MKVLLSSFVAGLIFALGLGISGMTQADKVINFLNVAGDWDPSLALVMVGAIAVHLALFKLILRRPTPVFADSFGIPTRNDIDARLVGGAALFGIGWALGGYCPGPGLVSVAGGSAHALTFVAAMTGGMMIFHAAHSSLLARRAAADEAGSPDKTPPVRSARSA